MCVAYLQAALAAVASGASATAASTIAAPAAAARSDSRCGNKKPTHLHGLNLPILSLLDAVRRGCSAASALVFSAEKLPTDASAISSA